MLDGKIQLTAFKNAKVKTIEGEECVVIPIKDNHLFKDRWGRIWVTVLAFPTTKLKPYTHNIIRSVEEKYRDGKQLIGGWKLKED